MIAVNNLTYTYRGEKKAAVDDVSFRVEKGEIFGFLGPSGAGKSTTQKILIKLLRGYSGQAMNFILVFPIPAFIFAGWWTNLLMIFPAWWIYRAFTSVAELPVFLSAAMTGMLFHVVVIILIAKLVFKKILNNA